MYAYIITFLFLLFILYVYFSSWSYSNKLTLFFIAWIESIVVMTVFVYPKSVLEGKFPLPPILFFFLVLSFLIYKCLKLQDYPKNKDNSLVGSIYFRSIGIIIIFSTILLEVFIFDGSFSANSLSLIIFGFYLVIFNFLDMHINYKKMLFIFLCLFVLSHPVATVIIKILKNNFDLFNDSAWSDSLVHLTLGVPVANFLSLFGFEVWTTGNTIFYIDKTVGHSSSVSIATGCSGIDSVVVFICALFSYLYVEYKILDPFTLALFLLGVMMSYFANILRMSIIIISGHYWGNDALQFAHTNVGWLIFTFWIFIFWRLMDSFIIDNIVENLKSER